MADRKKAKEAAIDFSVETSTPAAAPAAKPAKPKKAPVATASEILPGLRKSQREAVIPPHPRAAADKVKRQAEIAKGIDEARMPGQDAAEERWKSDRRPAYTQADRDAFAARQEEDRKKALEEYNTAPVSKDEEAAVKTTKIKRAKYPSGSRPPRKPRKGSK